VSSLYHILDKIPAINAEEISIEYEELAQDLVKSGKLRIDTDNSCNFARFTDPQYNISAMISNAEITDPILIPETQEYFKKLYSGKIAGNVFDSKLSSIFKNLKDQIGKLQSVNENTTIKLARIFVQSAHPIVIRWLLHDKVEVFITYSHSIGDMMDMQSWQHSGDNSGMQSTDGKNVAVFVSCGGNPFGIINTDHPTQGDGWPAVARLQIIAGQELGHFADIRRDEYGRQIGRHSANFSGTRAYDHVKIARKNDIIKCDFLLNNLANIGLNRLTEYDKKLKFYEKNKITGLKVIFLKVLQFLYKLKILNYAKKHKLFFIKRFSSDQYMGLMIKAMIEDMKFNLSPVADVYKRNDIEAEEAIACIEALARVPQQVMKWGYLTTQAAMYDLYKIYYNEVIPSLITNYCAMTGKSFKRNTKIPKKSFIQFLKRFLSLNKHEEKLVQVRDL
jgi:hypothetical protein